MKTFTLILAVATLVGCSEPPSAGNTVPSADGAGIEAAPAGEREMNGDAVNVQADANTSAAIPEATTDTVKAEADYLGRWTGVEGMYLVVAAKPGGGVTLEMQWDLDNKGTFEGAVTAEGLRFMRDGVAERAVHSDGDATGLKYLAGKQDCLTVKSGEGYCRD